MTKHYKLQSYNNFANELALYRFYIDTNLKTRSLAWELCPFFAGKTGALNIWK